MSGEVVQLSTQRLSEFRGGLAQAADAQLLQVVRMVDALEHRGAVDSVLDPVRARLRVIHPARPVRFGRLLFEAVNPLVVAAADWRPGGVFLPRHALPVISRFVRQAMVACPLGQESLKRIEALIAGATRRDSLIVGAAGELLWSAAARLLPLLMAAGEQSDAATQCRLAWTAQGLPEAELQPILAALCPILANARLLFDHDYLQGELSLGALTALVGEAAGAGVRATGMMLSLLLIRLPEEGAALLASIRGSSRLAPPLEIASDAALDYLERRASRQPDKLSDNAPDALRRQSTLLEALAGAETRMATRRRLGEARAHLLNSSVKLIETALQDQVAAPLACLPESPDARDTALDELETSARNLRRYESETRRLGGGARLDRLVADACGVVTRADSLSRMDRARLVEIFAGTAAAARML